MISKLLNTNHVILWKAYSIKSIVFVQTDYAKSAFLSCNTYKFDH